MATLNYEITTSGCRVAGQRRASLRHVGVLDLRHRLCIGAHPAEGVYQVGMILD
jgi:hypothetical protein